MYLCRLIPKKKKKPCEVYRFLRAHPPVCRACGFDLRTRRELIDQGMDPDRDLPSPLQPLPCERTFRRRFPKLDRTTRQQIRTLGEHLLDDADVTDATTVSVEDRAGTKRIDEELTILMQKVF